MHVVETILADKINTLEALSAVNLAGLLYLMRCEQIDEHATRVD